MSESAIRTEVYNIVNSVPNIGKVYDYERWAVNWGDFINLFKTTDGKILGWEIGRKAPVGDDENAQGTIRTHTYFIRGYMVVNDSSTSEKSFNTLIENICATFRDKKDINGAALGSEYIKIEVLDTRTFGGVLCHFVELTLTVYEHIA